MLRDVANPIRNMLHDVDETDDDRRMTGRMDRGRTTTGRHDGTDGQRMADDDDRTDGRTENDAGDDGADTTGRTDGGRTTTGRTTGRTGGRTEDERWYVLTNFQIRHRDRN